MERSGQSGEGAPGPWGAANVTASPEADFVVRNTDFRAARQRNIRATARLILLLTALAAAVGYLGGWGLEVILHQHPGLNQLTPSASYMDMLRTLGPSLWGGTGAAGMLVISLLLTLLVFWRGDRAVMRISGARPADTDSDARLHNVTEEMAIAAGIPKPAVYVVETDSLNAFATGLRSSQSAIGVTRGLAEQLNREELQAVVGHEVAHIVNGDARQATALATMVGMIVLVSEIMRQALFVIVSGAGRRNARSSSPLPLMLPVLIVWMIVALLAPLAATLLRLAVSREREYLADATAVQLTRNPVALASALQKISAKPQVASARTATAHLFIECPMAKTRSGIEGLFATHPPASKRIDRVLNL